LARLRTVFQSTLWVVQKKFCTKISINNIAVNQKMIIFVCKIQVIKKRGGKVGCCGARKGVYELWHSHGMGFMAQMAARADHAVKTAEVL